MGMVLQDGFMPICTRCDRFLMNREWMCQGCVSNGIISSGVDEVRKHCSNPRFYILNGFWLTRMTRKLNELEKLNFNA